jgi:hypothetical protein
MILISFWERLCVSILIGRLVGHGASSLELGLAAFLFSFFVIPRQRL